MTPKKVTSKVQVASSVARSTGSRAGRSYGQSHHRQAEANNGSAYSSTISSDSEYSEDELDDEAELPFLIDKDYKDPDSSSKEDTGDNQNGKGLPTDPSKVDERVNTLHCDLNPEEILFFGLLKVGFDECSQYRTRYSLRVARFKAHFGVGPNTLRAILMDVRKEYDYAHLKYLLLSMNWLKLYDTEHVAAARWKHCEDTIHSQEAKGVC